MQLNFIDGYGPLANFCTGPSNPLRGTALQILNDFNSAMGAIDAEDEGSIDIDEDEVKRILERFYNCFSGSQDESATNLTRRNPLGVFKLVWEDEYFRLNMIKLLHSNFWDIDGVISVLLRIVKTMDKLSINYTTMVYSIDLFEALIILGRRKTKELYFISWINKRR
jgi:hypothetical protein